MLDKFRRHNTKVVEMDCNQFGTQLVAVIFWCEVAKNKNKLQTMTCNYEVTTMTNYKILNFF
jgi:hypothetical protein